MLCSATFHERGIEFFCEASSGSLTIRANADDSASDLPHWVAAELLPAVATVFAELLGVSHEAPAHDCENALEELARVDLAPHLAAADKRVRDTSQEILRLHGELTAAHKRIAELEASAKARTHTDDARAVLDEVRAALGAEQGQNIAEVAREARRVVDFYTKAMSIHEAEAARHGRHVAHLITSGKDFTIVAAREVGGDGTVSMRVRSLSSGRQVTRPRRRARAAP